MFPAYCARMYYLVNASAVYWHLTFINHVLQIIEIAFWLFGFLRVSENNKSKFLTLLPIPDFLTTPPRWVFYTSRQHRWGEGVPFPTLNILLLDTLIIC